MTCNDFIYQAPNTLPDDFCDLLIEKFNNSKNIQVGRTGNGVDKSKKDSKDIVISTQSEWKPEVNQLSHHLLSAMIPYFRAHPFLLLGAISMAMVDPNTQQQINITHEHISQMGDQQISQLIRRLYRLGDINMQQYKQGVGGYHHWHSEVFPHPNPVNSDPLHRVLLWMFYLNDVEEGGETSFYFQQQNIPPKKGTLVIAPAGFTHTHKGQVPISNDKFILTSWLMFRTAEQIYPK